MDSASFSFLGQQLAYSLPQLLVYLVGLILAIIFFRKYSTAALLVLCGSIVLLVTSLGQTFIQFYLFRARVESGWSAAGYAQMLLIVSMVANIIRALGLALWLAAVFVGRKSKTIVPL
jgi:hypothetical protein